MNHEKREMGNGKWSLRGFVTVLVLARDVLLTRVIVSIRLDQPQHTYGVQSALIYEYHVLFRQKTCP